MKLKELPEPVSFDPEAWSMEPATPHGYRLKVDMNDLRKVIRPAKDGPKGNSRLRLLGSLVIVANLQLETPAEDPSCPIYFEVEGATFNYVFSIWLDRVTIEVQTKHYETLSILWPTTPDQLSRTLRTIVNDR